MRNCAVGARKAGRKWPGLWCAVLILYWSPTTLSAPRRAWIFDQLGPPPLTKASPDNVGAEAATLGTITSLQLSAFVNLDYVEVGVLGSRRLVPTRTGIAGDIQQVLDEEHTTFGVQLGRSLTHGNKFGRFGLGYYVFFPRNERQWAGLHIDTGLVPSVESPWRAHLKIAAFFPLYPDSELFQISAKVLHKLLGGAGTDFSLGARFLWSSFFKPKGDGVQREYMLIALGPAAQLTTSKWGILVLETTWRLWLDKHFSPTSSVTVGSAEAVPGLRLNWTVSF